MVLPNDRLWSAISSVLTPKRGVGERGSCLAAACRRKLRHLPAALQAAAFGVEAKRELNGVLSLVITKRDRCRAGVSHVEVSEEGAKVTGVKMGLGLRWVTKSALS